MDAAVTPDGAALNEAVLNCVEGGCITIDAISSQLNLARSKVRDAVSDLWSEGRIEIEYIETPTMVLRKKEGDK